MHLLEPLQLFSSREHRIECYNIIKNWKYENVFEDLQDDLPKKQFLTEHITGQETAQAKSERTVHLQNDTAFDWEKLQIEYRDYLDFSKMLQLIPVIGAPIGMFANNKLMEQLKVTVMNCYRLRKCR